MHFSMHETRYIQQFADSEKWCRVFNENPKAGSAKHSIVNKVVEWIDF